MSENEPEKLEIWLPPHAMEELEKLAFRGGYESVGHLGRQIVWIYLFGHLPPEIRAKPGEVEKDIRAVRVNPSLKLRVAVLLRDGRRCVYCGATAATTTLHMDHVIPVSKGGKTVLENLQTLCESCNRGKAADLLEVT